MSKFSLNRRKQKNYFLPRMFWTAYTSIMVSKIKPVILTAKAWLTFHDIFHKNMRMLCSLITMWEMNV